MKSKNLDSPCSIISYFRQSICQPFDGAHVLVGEVKCWLPAERTMALLAFEDTRSSPVADLMDISQRQKTASELNAAILSSQCQVICVPCSLQIN